MLRTGWSKSSVQSRHSREKPRHLVTIRTATMWAARHGNADLAPRRPRDTVGCEDESPVLPPPNQGFGGYMIYIYIYVYSIYEGINIV